MIQHLPLFASVSLWLVPLACAELPLRLEMWEEPSHQLVFAEGPVRVLSIRIAPAQTSDFHVHRYATAYIVIQDARMASQVWDEGWSDSGARSLRHPGATIDRSDYVDNDFYHRVRNDDEQAFHMVAVVNEEMETNDPLGPPKKAAISPIDNRWFKESRVSLAANSRSDILNFNHAVVLVQFSDGASHILENGVEHSFKNTPGAFSWHPAGSEFQIGNRSNKTLELVLIEAKD
jgi:hypothetical protein